MANITEITKKIENFFKKAEELSQKTKFFTKLISAWGKGMKAFNDELFDRVKEGTNEVS